MIWCLGDDFDGAAKIPDDGPLMEITLMVPCMDDDALMYMMMPNLLDDGALEFDDGLGSMSIAMPLIEMTCQTFACVEDSLAYHPLPILRHAFITLLHHPLTYSTLLTPIKP